MFNRLLDRLEEALIASLMAAATLIIFAAVVHRYSLTGLIGLSSWARAHELPWLFTAARGGFGWLRQVNLTWAQEACITMFVWMAKFGAAYGVRTGIHVGVDVIVRQAPPRLARALVLFGLLSGALFTGTIAVLGWRFVAGNGMEQFVLAGLGVATSLPVGPTTPDLELPTWIVYLAIPLGSSLMCYRFLQVAWRFAATGEAPHHDPGAVDGLDDPEPAL